jgi:hypothetical protein
LKVIVLDKGWAALTDVFSNLFGVVGSRVDPLGLVLLELLILVEVKHLF